MTEKEKEELRARTLKAIEDTKKEMESDPPDTEYFYSDDIEKLIEASDNGDIEATKKLLQLFNSSEELKEYIKTIKEILELQPLVKELIEEWKKAKKDGNVKKAKSLKKKILSYNSVRSEQIYIDNSKVARNILVIHDNSKNKQSTSLRVSKEKAKQVVNIITSFDEMTISGDPLTPFDRAVLNAVSTIWEAVKDTKDKTFTLKQVYRIMNGVTDDNKFINPQKLDDIRKSINHCRVKLLRIDATEQVEVLYKNEKGILKYYEGYLMPVEKAVVEMNNGELVDAYAFIKCPIIHEHSKNCGGQIINVPIKLLDTSKVLSNTNEIVVFRERLIQRIAAMKNKRNKMNNTKIRYDDIFKYAGIDTEKINAIEVKRKRDNIKKILEHFINEKFIKGFEEYKEGRALAGIDIKV